MSIANNKTHKAIFEDWHNGMTRESIAEKYGYKLSSINGVLGKLGISFARDLTEEYAAIEKMYAEGNTVKDIGIALGLGTTTVKNRLIKSGKYKIRCRVKNYKGCLKEEFEDETNLTYALPKQIKKVVKDGKRYDDVTEMLFQQYEG